MNRLKTAQYIALGATLCTIIGVFGLVNNNAFLASLMGFGAVAGIVSYFFGGFGNAVRIAGKIAKFGWFILPFPIDIISLLFTFILSIYVFLFLPIIPVRKAYKESL